MYAKGSASKISETPYDLGTQFQVFFNPSALKDLVMMKVFLFPVKAMFPDPGALAYAVLGEIPFTPYFNRLTFTHMSGLTLGSTSSRSHPCLPKSVLLLCLWHTA